MNVSIVTGGLLGQGLVTSGFMPGPVAPPLSVFVNPRKMRTMTDITSMSAADPRKMRITSDNTSITDADPRKMTMTYD